MKKEIVLRWMKKGDNDLKAVEHLLEFEDAPTDIITFHCEQAVEKYLKAYLTFVNIRVKKTHDLESILNLCIEKDKEFETLDREKISELTFYGVEVRYPDDFYEPTIEEAKETVEIARKVKEFIIKKINL